MARNVSEKDFLQCLSRILFECGHIKKGEKVLFTTQFSQDLALDSLDTLEIIKDMEDEYHVDLSMVSQDQIHSVNDFYNVFKNNMFTPEKRMQNLYHRGKSRSALYAKNRETKKYAMALCKRQYNG